MILKLPKLLQGSVITPGALQKNRRHSKCLHCDWRTNNLSCN